MPLRISISLLLLLFALAYAFFRIGRGGRLLGSLRPLPAGKALEPPAPPTGQQARTRREEKIKNLIRGIPKGKVVTFAVLSAHAGPGFEVLKISREVRAFASEGELPWWRVVRRDGQRGMVSSSAELAKRQQQLLEAEGIEFQKGTFDLAKYQWEP